MTADLRALAEAATPGPWLEDGPIWLADDADGNPRASCLVVDGERNAVVVPHRTADPHRANADIAYIAAASPDVVLALLDRLDAAEALLREVARNLDHVASANDAALLGVRIAAHLDGPPT